jgi:hypothetical protein
MVRALSAVILAALCTTAYASDALCVSAGVVPYEPTVVTLEGRVVVARSRHPNGTKLVYPILRLDKPITVDGGAEPRDPINAREECVKEVQLYAQESKLRTKLLAQGRKRAIVTGTLFHEHTAWHMRKIVMDVTAAEVKMGSNHTPHADAHEAPRTTGEIVVRASGRER